MAMQEVDTHPPSQQSGHSGWQTRQSEPSLRVPVSPGVASVVQWASSGRGQVQDWVDGELSFYTAHDQSPLPIQWLILLENKTLTCRRREWREVKDQKRGEVAQ